MSNITEGEVISIDGKTIRGSRRKDSKYFVHMVSTWANVNHLSLGQVKVNEKSNEITAIPKLLEVLAIKGCIVTIDAMGLGINPNFIKPNLTYTHCGHGRIVELDKEFDRIFTTKTDYFQLNQRIEKTYANKDKLLVVLKHTFIPLHNNASELAARRVVTQKKNQLTDIGTKTRDAAMGVVETAKKLKVNVIDYIEDRISEKYQMPDLANLILMYSS